MCGNDDTSLWNLLRGSWLVYWLGYKSKSWIWILLLSTVSSNVLLKSPLRRTICFCLPSLCCFAYLHVYLWGYKWPHCVREPRHPCTVCGCLFAVFQVHMVVIGNKSELTERRQVQFDTAQAWAAKEKCKFRPFAFSSSCYFFFFFLAAWTITR